MGHAKYVRRLAACAWAGWCAVALCAVGAMGAAAQVAPPPERDAVEQRLLLLLELLPGNQSATESAQVGFQPRQPLGNG